MKVIGIIATMIFLVSIAYAGDNHTISGEVFLKKMVTYIYALIPRKNFLKAIAVVIIYQRGVRLLR